MPCCCITLTLKHIALLISLRISSKTEGVSSRKHTVTAEVVFPELPLCYWKVFKFPLFRLLLLPIKIIMTKRKKLDPIFGGNPPNNALVLNPQTGLSWEKLLRTPKERILIVLMHSEGTSHATETFTSLKDNDSLALQACGLHNGREYLNTILHSVSQREFINTLKGPSRTLRVPGDWR